MAKNHYQVLQVNRTASYAEIKSAYRKLVKIYHPDQSTEVNAEAMFIRIVEAYEVLTDVDRKRNYDRMLDLESNVAKATPKKSAPTPPVKPPQKQPATNTKPVSETMLLLEQLIRKGRFGEAEKLAKKLKTIDPRNAKPYAILGDIARMRGELEIAAEQYAYAMQMDPTKIEYEREHARVLTSLSKKRDYMIGAKPASVVSLYVGSCVLFASFMVICIARERPAFPQLTPVSTWSLSMFVLLFVCGVSIGACFALSGFLERFGSSTGSTVVRVPPSLLLGVIAIVNFWVALGLYLLVGSTQRAFNASTSRILGGVSLIALLMAVASGISSEIAPLQTLLWSGNIAYVGVICGWMTADAFRQ